MVLLKTWHSVTNVVLPSQVLSTAVSLAKEIVSNSPDAVWSTKKALLEGQQHSSLEDAVIRHNLSEESKKVYQGDNIREGLLAFSEVSFICVNLDFETYAPAIRNASPFGQTLSFETGGYVIAYCRFTLELGRFASRALTKLIHIYLAMCGPSMDPYGKLGCRLFL